VHDRRQQVAIRPLEADLVDLEQLECFARDLERHHACMADLRDVADATEDAIRDPRGPARTARDLVRRGLLDLHVQDPR
jgi:hypothetical protein